VSEELDELIEVERTITHDGVESHVSKGARRGAPFFYVVPTECRYPSSSRSFFEGPRLLRMTV
jgi:hypothetical protein